MENIVFGRNNVFELICEGNREINKIILMKDIKLNPKINKILDIARQKGILFQFLPKEKFQQFKEYSH